MKCLLSYSLLLLAFIKFNESLPLTDDYDMLVLRQFWPATSCMFPGDNKCSIPSKVTNWGIHGLWPSYFVPRPGPNYGPSYCNTSESFKLETIKQLLPDLEVHWPNLYTDTALDYLWVHEWDKHGTCALGLNGLTNQSDYFKVTLAMREEYDFGAILEQNGVTPTDETPYKLSNFIDAFKNSLQIEPVMACFTNNSTNKQYLGEMHICLDKTYHLISCQSTGGSRIIKRNVVDGLGESPCSDSMPIYYPTI